MIVKDPMMFSPIIMFIDAMKVDNLAGKLKLEPIHSLSQYLNVGLGTKTIPGELGPIWKR